MRFSGYAEQNFQVRENIVRNHQRTWSKLAQAGSFWTGEQRVEIARITRTTRNKRNDPPWQRSAPPAAAGLSAEDVEAVRIIAVDAQRISRAWVQGHIARIGAGAWVELGAIVATVTAIDTFCDALGVAQEPLPEPRAGTPHGKVAETVDIGAYVPMMTPWQGPNVGRALSLVPGANMMFMANVMAMYSCREGGFFDMVWHGALSRPQAELVAARVSAVNECFY